MCRCNQLWRRIKLWWITMNVNLMKRRLLFMMIILCFAFLIGTLYAYRADLTLPIYIILAVTCGLIFIIFLVFAFLEDIKILKLNRARLQLQENQRNVNLITQRSTETEMSPDLHDSTNLGERDINQRTSRYPKRNPTDRMLRGFRPKTDETPQNKLAVFRESLTQSQRQLRSHQTSRSLCGTPKQLSASSLRREFYKYTIPNIEITPRSFSDVNFGASTSRSSYEDYDYRNLQVPTRIHQTSPRGKHSPAKYANFEADYSSDETESIASNKSFHKYDKSSRESRSDVSGESSTKGSPSSKKDLSKETEESPSNKCSSEESEESSTENSSHSRTRHSKLFPKSKPIEALKSSKRNVAREILKNPSSDCGKKSPKRRKSSEQSSCAVHKILTRSTSKKVAASEAKVSDKLEQKESSSSLDQTCPDSHPQKKTKPVSGKSSYVDDKSNLSMQSRFQSDQKTGRNLSPTKRKARGKDISPFKYRKWYEPPLEKIPKTDSGSSSGSE